MLPSNKHGVEHHPKAPHVGCSPRVLRVAGKNFRADVGRATVLVREQVVGVVIQDDGVLKRFQLKFSSEREQFGFNLR